MTPELVCGRGGGGGGGGGGGAKVSKHPVFASTCYNWNIKNKKSRGSFHGAL